MTNPNIDATYGYSGPMKGLFLFGIIFFGSGLVGSIAVIFVSPNVLERLGWVWFLVIIGYGYFSKIYITAWLERDNRVRVDDNGIAVHSKSSQLEVIKWADIVDVKIHRFRKRLTITDKFNKKMKLEFEIQNFSMLLKTIIEHIPQLDTVSTSLHKLSRRFKVS